MKLKKFNAIISLFSTTLLLLHAISLALWMLSKGKIPRVPTFTSKVLVLVTVIHAIVSIIIMIKTNKGNKKSKGRKYKKLNFGTVWQRITGPLLIIFTWLHIAGTLGIMTPPPVIHAVVTPLFFTLVLAHVAVSTSKAFITLGIGSAAFVKRADRVIKVICAVTLIADVVGFYLHVC